MSGVLPGAAAIEYTPGSRMLQVVDELVANARMRSESPARSAGSRP
jgi:hypothetical protein